MDDILRRSKKLITVFPLMSATGANLISQLLLIRGRRLKEGGAYFSVRYSRTATNFLFFITCIRV